MPFARESQRRIRSAAPGALALAGRDLLKHRYIYLMILPAVVFYFVFHYIPLYGAQIAFRDFSPTKGFLRSQWVGLQHFRDFFGNLFFWRILRNTVLINLYSLVFGFPAPVILALLLNEVRNAAFKRTVQSISYLPHFISLVVVCGMIVDFLARDGVINQILSTFGVQPTPFMIQPEWFRTIYVSSSIWQEVGWGSIIYLAALAGIDPQLYEAAAMDGAGRFRQMFAITIPSILPTVIIMLILRMGTLFSLGAEKILLLYNSNTYETADVIATYVYRKGLLEMGYSYSAAVGLFDSLINFALLLAVNRISRKLTETSLW